MRVLINDISHHQSSKVITSHNSHQCELGNGWERLLMALFLWEVIKHHRGGLKQRSYGCKPNTVQRLTGPGLFTKESFLSLTILQVDGKRYRSTPSKPANGFRKHQEIQIPRYFADNRPACYPLTSPVTNLKASSCKHNFIAVP